MINTLYRLFLAFNATLLIVVVYLINKKYTLNILESYPSYISGIIFVIVPIALTWMSFGILQYLSDDNILRENILEIELANNSFLPTYLGYFFVSLGILDCQILIFVFTIIYIFTFLSQTLYFNPIFLLFGYHFYFLTNSNNAKIFLITKKKLKTPRDYDFNRLKRINDYTFIDRE